MIGPANLLGNFDSGNGSHRRLAGRFPYSGVAANRGQSAVPGPNCHRKIEGCNDANVPKRMPLFEHSMLRSLGSDGQPVQLSRKADGEVAYINHLLHFALSFSKDFTSLQSHQSTEITFGFAQGIAKLPNDLSSLGRGQQLPFGKGVAG